MVVSLRSVLSVTAGSSSRQGAPSACRGVVAFDAGNVALLDHMSFCNSRIRTSCLVEGSHFRPIVELWAHDWNLPFASRWQRLSLQNGLTFNFHKEVRTGQSRHDGCGPSGIFAF